jgi:Ala-tRNA(Pro) deacylase
VIPERIRAYLDEHGVPYRVRPHEPEATAQATAARTHVSGKRFAKAVVLKRDGQLVLAVVPAHESASLEKIGRALGGAVELPDEDEFVARFPDCEPGAMPPLGHLYGMDVVAHACLADRGTIVMNGGTHTDAIEMDWRDFFALEHPALVPA